MKSVGSSSHHATTGGGGGGGGGVGATHNHVKPRYK